MANEYFREELENIAQSFIDDQKANIDKMCKGWCDRNNENIIPVLTEEYIDKYYSLSGAESFKCVGRIKGIDELNLNYGDTVIVATLIRVHSHMISQYAFDKLKEMLKKFHGVDINKRVGE